MTNSASYSLLLEICAGSKPGKGGGLGAGLAAPPRKTKLATETTTSTSSKDQVSGREDKPVGLSMKCCSESCKEAAVQTCCTQSL